MEMEIASQQSFSELLNLELKRRVENNPRYSIRAFARQLKVDHSHLAKILKGQRTVSERFVDWAGWTLNWPPEKIVRTKRMTGVSHSKTGRKLRAADDLRFNAISFDEFQAISQLVHFTILEMTELSEFHPSIPSIARRLNLGSDEVTQATDRLKKMGALVDTVTGLRSTKRFTTTNHPGSNAAFRRLQEEILERAIRALHNIPLERREQSAITMAIDSKKLPEAKARVKKFRRELMEFLQDSPSRDLVYQLSISLFPLESGEK